MPGGDRTGPMGQGPMTGRGLGYGGGYNMPGYMNPAGRIRGRLRRRGRFGAGRGGRFWGRGRLYPYDEEWQR